jgi:hypothetical protein
MRHDDAGDERWNKAERGETPMQSQDRHYAELLQELRVVQTGIQILMAFLLTVAFSQRFTALDHSMRILYVVTLVLGAGATSLLMAPVAFHRVVFEQRLRRQLIAASNVFALGGLVLLVLTLAAAMFLITNVVIGFGWASFVTAGLVVWFVLIWLVVPLWVRIRDARRPQRP